MEWHRRRRTLAIGLAFLQIAVAFAAACNTGDDLADSNPLAALAGAVATATRAPTATPVPNDPYPAGAVGYAISWPQCGGPYPAEFAFGIVGVNYGRAFTKNPCFAEEYRWAKRGPYHPSIYMNTNYLTSRTGLRDVEACGADATCRAYRYGRAAAQDAYTYAASVDGVAPVWWLDVQIVSNWSVDVAQNAQAIRGAAEYLKSKGIRVGISSTSYQWATVAGPALHNMPVWDASAFDAEMAANFCRQGKDFAGGRTEQIAYVAKSFETVLACGLAAPSAAP